MRSGISSFGADADFSGESAEEVLTTHKNSRQFALSDRRISPIKESAANKDADEHPADAALVALFLALGVEPGFINIAIRDGPRHTPLWADNLIASGKVGEAEVLSYLASLIGADFTHSPPPLPKKMPASEAYALRQYSCPARDGHLDTVIIPDSYALRALLAGKSHTNSKRTRIILTTRQAFLDVILRADPKKCAKRAASTLPALLSARREEPLRALFRGRITPLIIIALIFINIILFGLGSLLFLFPLLLCPIFIIASLSVLRATFEAIKPVSAPPYLPQNDLPRYTILVPLFQEAAVVPRLIERMDKLVYPREKLEILFLVEEGDTQTRTALAHISLPASMLVLTLPPGQPKTKPRALNLALPFVRGECLVVYDAEDAPEPDQLLKASALFAVSPRRVACLQARLAISNARDGFLTRRFAVDYASLFDCIKAGMARLGWPVPLGGTSNHFRVSVLRTIGAWDAWNVTEDADLGLRLARFGWKVSDLPSTTWEEAPNTLASWLNQRTRWLKGWFQTLVVHSRKPKRAMREFGAFNSLIITSIGVAFLIGALFQPFFALALLYRLLSHLPLFGGGWLLDIADSAIIGSLILASLSEIIPAFLALSRRKAFWLMPFILLAPITHVLIFVSAWRALREWIKMPFHWHKTRHGLAKHEDKLS